MNAEGDWIVHEIHEAQSNVKVLRYKKDTGQGWDTWDLWEEFLNCWVDMLSAEVVMFIEEGTGRIGSAP